MQMENEWKLVARIALGEALKDGIGAILVELCDNTGDAQVYVNGGTLPDGEERCKFMDLGDAMEYVAELIQDHGAELADR
jgi:hypothetical protein